MCIALFVYDVHPALLLLLAFNRDEFWDRPTLPAHFWPDEPTLLAGRDALRKGTWLGMTRSGRFAFLTNFREPINQSDPAMPADGTPAAAPAAAAASTSAAPPAAEPASGGSFLKTTTAPSRGALTTDFLTGTMPPLEYLQALNTTDFFGFNLLVGDLQRQQLAYLSNRDSDTPCALPPGIYGVSNGLLQQWPKVQKGLRAFADCMDLPAPAAGSSGDALGEPQQQQEQQPGDGCGLADGGDGAEDVVPWQHLFQRVMGDINGAAAHEVPLTGVGEELDRRLSSIFVEPFEIQPGSTYGTRSQTVIAVWRDGRVEQRERYIEKREEADECQGGAGVGSNCQQQQAAAQTPQQAKAVDESQWVWREVRHAFDMGPAAGDAATSAATSSQQLCEA